MAITALHTSASGLTALSQEIDIIANNLANVNTVGFKSLRANFEDLLYQAKAEPGVENAGGQQTPAGLFVGLGTRVSNTQFDFTQGSAVNTGRKLDLMIDGIGVFKVAVLPSQSETGFAYTRAGNFFTNANGELVLGNAQGPRLEPPITIPPDTTDVQIDQQGNVNAVQPTATTNVGQIQLSTFVNPNGLIPIGGNLLKESPASGPPIDGFPGDAQFGRIQQSFLESSNVDPVKELVSLIKTQRAFEMNSQTIQAADETLQVVANLRRF